jgi:hypothetical protein
MKILNIPHRLSGSTIKNNLFLLVVDYEIPESELGLNGKSVKDTICSFKELYTKSSNFNEYKQSTISQIPLYSLDLLSYRIKNIIKYFHNFWTGLNIMYPCGPP